MQSPTSTSSARRATANWNGSPGTSRIVVGHVLHEAFGLLDRVMLPRLEPGHVVIGAVGMEVGDVAGHESPQPQPQPVGLDRGEGRIAHVAT